MTEMTPEKLLEWVNDYQEVELLEGAARAAVSAWKADREQLRLAIVDQANTEAELNEAQTRQISRQNGEIARLLLAANTRIEALWLENGILKGNLPHRTLRHLMATGVIAKAPTIYQVERDRAALAAKEETCPSE